MSRRNYSRQSMESKELLSDLVSISGLPSVGKGILIRTLRSRHASARPMVRYIGADDVMAHYARTQSHKGELVREAFAREAWYRCNFDLETMGQLNCNWIAAQMAHIFAPKGFHVKLNRSMGLRLQEMGLQGVDISESQLRMEDEGLAAAFEERFPGCSWSEGDFDLVVNMDEYPGYAVNVVADIVVSKYLEWQRQNTWKMSFYAA